MSTRYQSAKEIYSGFGVNTEAAIDTLSKVKISIHCWQGDDVLGFEGSKSLSGGIATTGNYPGRARNAEELMNDLDLVLSLVPGKHKINLHAIYAITDEKVARDRLEPRHFSAWVDYAKERGLGLDINPTLFSHEKAADGLTLSHPDAGIRRFWIDHCRAMRRVGEYFGKETGMTCLDNIWIPDGYKDTPADRYSPRRRFAESLDEILADKYDPKYLVDSIESKVFGIGVESYTVGSHEFCMNYAAKNGCLCLLDNGHFHPTENVADKIPSMLLFFDKIALHVTRGIRWDSDHAVTLNDEILDIAKELVRCNAFDRTFIGLDYFDASINRILAWTTGIRNFQKALLTALLTPFDSMAKLQHEGDFSSLLALGEEYKLSPVGDVWTEFCERENAPSSPAWIDTVKGYERDVLSKR